MKKYLIASFAVLALLGTSRVAHADITSNMLLYYELEDNQSNLNVTDSSGNGHTGSVTGSSEDFSSPGKIGSGFAFTGSQNIETGYTWSASDPDLTLSIWFKTTGISETFFSTYNGQQGLIGMLLDNGGRPECQIQSSNGHFNYSYLGTRYNDGAWHHMACVMSGTTLNMYMDGAVIDTVTDAGWNGNYAGRAPRTFFIGSGFTGTLDEARIYDRGFSASDIAELYAYTGASQSGGGSGGATQSPGVSQLSGWAWSSNVGWISFNSSDNGTGNNGSGKSSVVYHVDVSTSTGNNTATFSGYAWSPHIGWISFQPADAASCGSAVTGAVDSNGNFSGLVSGFARVVSEIGRNDGWDGCVKLGDSASGNPLFSPATQTFTGSDNATYLKGGVTYSPLSQIFKGFAWSSTVLGWLSFQNPFPVGSVRVISTTTDPNGGPDFLITGNQVALPKTGTVTTTMTINRVGADVTEQSIAEALSNVPSGVTATITDSPATCVLTGATVSCTVHITVTSNNATPGTYTATLTGTRALPTAVTHTGSLAVTIQSVSENPINLFIAPSASGFNVPDSQKSTTLSIKKGNTFALQWQINLDPGEYSCFTWVNKGSWPVWGSTDLSDYVTGSQSVGSLSSISTSGNNASSYSFAINCQSNENNPTVSAGATLILQSSSESEI